MIETNNKNINVDEIMEKIREEVAKRKGGGVRSPQPAHKSAYAAQPLGSSHWSQVSSSLTMAEHFREVGTTNSVMQKYPKPIRWLALLVGRIVLHLTQPVSFPQRKFNQSILQALQTMLDGVRELQQEVSGRLDSIAALESHINELTKQKADRGEVMMLDAQKADKTELQPLWEQKADKMELQPLWEQKADKAELQPLWEQKADKTELQPLQEQKADKTELQPLWEQKADKTELQPLWEHKADKNELQNLLRQIRDHKLNIMDQERRLRLLLEEARKRLPKPISTEQIEHMLTEEDQMLSAMYVSFEDQFRGTREDIKERQKVYLPYLKDARVGTKKAPILDVGCGRGEWLELCREHNLFAKGVDINRVMVNQCLESEFDVAQADAIAFLREQKPNSFGAITGFHIVEHLPLHLLLALFDETLRVLKPGGLVIFETPNPDNLIVASRNFYIDPTHKNPLPGEMLKFLSEARGFVNAAIVNLHPALEFEEIDKQDKFAKLLYGPQDYAVIAYKL